jgi:hypothetical protein
MAVGKTRGTLGTVSVGRWTAPIAAHEPTLEVMETESTPGSHFSVTIWGVAQPPFKIDQQVTLTMATPAKKLSIRGKLSARSNTSDRMFLAFERC